MFRVCPPLRSFLCAAALALIALGAPARAEAFSLTAITTQVQELSTDTPGSPDPGSLFTLWRWLTASRFDIDLPIGFQGALAGAVTQIAEAARAPRLVEFPVAGRHQASSPFGYRRHPLEHRRRLHTGMDFAAKPGTPVVAAAAGVVSFAKRMGGYGRMVVVDHGNGIKTRYAHLRRIVVKEGEVVDAGDKVGAVGSSGWATGPHLHFEVRTEGEAVDPAPLLAALEAAH